MAFRWKQEEQREQGEQVVSNPETERKRKGGREREDERSKREARGRKRNETADFF